METESEHATGILISFVKEMFYDEEYSIVFTYNEKKQNMIQCVSLNLFCATEEDEEAQLIMSIVYDKTGRIIKKFKMHEEFEKLFVKKYDVIHYDHLTKMLKCKNLPLSLDFQGSQMNSLLEEIKQFCIEDNVQVWDGKNYYYK